MFMCFFLQIKWENIANVILASAIQQVTYMLWKRPLLSSVQR